MGVPAARESEDLEPYLAGPRLIEREMRSSVPGGNVVSRVVEGGILALAVEADPDIEAASEVKAEEELVVLAILLIPPVAVTWVRLPAAS